MQDNKSIEKKLSDSIREAVISSGYQVEYINISPIALNVLMLTTDYMHASVFDGPLMWHGVELRESYNLDGLDFNIVTKDTAKGYSLPREMTDFNSLPKN